MIPISFVVRFDRDSTFSGTSKATLTYDCVISTKRALPRLSKRMNCSPLCDSDDLVTPKLWEVWKATVGLHQTVA